MLPEAKKERHKSYLGADWERKITTAVLAAGDKLVGTARNVSVRQYLDANESICTRDAWSVTSKRLPQHRLVISIPSNAYHNSVTTDSRQSLIIRMCISQVNYLIIIDQICRLLLRPPGMRRLLVSQSRHLTFASGCSFQECIAKGKCCPARHIWPR